MNSFRNTLITRAEWSQLLAQSGHHGSRPECPLSGAKQTSLGGRDMSAFVFARVTNTDNAAAYDCQLDWCGVWPSTTDWLARWYSCSTRTSEGQRLLM